MSSETNPSDVPGTSASALASSTSEAPGVNADSNTNANGNEGVVSKPRARLGPVETVIVPNHYDDDSDSEADEDADAPAVDGDKGEGEGAGDDFLKTYPDDTEVRLRLPLSLRSILPFEG